uniref:Uncharacterized protein n=1 Tax=Oryza brachyantha TaxID=4533 RepID=J3LYF8_ORYBR
MERRNRVQLSSAARFPSLLHTSCFIRTRWKTLRTLSSPKCRYGAAGSYGMLRHLFQKGANMVNDWPSSSTTSHGSYSRSALKDCTMMPSTAIICFSRWSLTSEIGSETMTQ